MWTFYASYTFCQIIFSRWCVNLSSTNSIWECPSHCIFARIGCYHFLKISLFLDVDHFSSLYWICFNIAPVSSFWFFDYEACGTLVPWPGMEQHLPALEAQSLNHWTAREVEVPLVLISVLWLLKTWNIVFISAYVLPRGSRVRTGSTPRQLWFRGLEHCHMLRCFQRLEWGQ